MKKISPISNHKELVLELALLRNEKMEKELVLNTGIKDLIHSFGQNMNLKNLIRQVADDNEIKKNLLKIGLNISTNFLLKKFFPQENQNEALPRKNSLFELIRSFI